MQLLAAPETSHSSPHCSGDVVTPFSLGAPELVAAGNSYLEASGAPHLSSPHMAVPVPAGAPEAAAQGAPEPLACETLPLYSLELDGVFAVLRGFRGAPEIETQNNNPTLLALESQIRANPFDRRTWDSLLSVSLTALAAAVEATDSAASLLR